jgi:hypothetical protein
VNCPKERGRAILATRLDFRTAFDKDAHHLHVRVQSGTHESGVPRFIARVCIRSLLKQVLHLRSVAVADGVKENLVGDALIEPISYPNTD